MDSIGHNGSACRIVIAQAGMAAWLLAVPSGMPFALCARVRPHPARASLAARGGCRCWCGPWALRMVLVLTTWLPRGWAWSRLLPIVSATIWSFRRSRSTRSRLRAGPDRQGVGAGDAAEARS